MSIQFPSFIGRSRELLQIERQIKRQGVSVAINIAGAGGIGKTAILKKIKKQHQSARAILVTDIIDFSHTVHRSEAWILEQIIAVARDKFPTYKKKMQKLQSAAEPLTRLQYESELVDAFVEDFNRIARRRRVILLFDTLELIQDAPLFIFILEVAKRLANIVLVLAGRNNAQEDFTIELNRIFKKNQIKQINLPGFDKKEADRYFKETIAPRLGSIHPNQRENIYFLSDGKPIKIALSLDWLNRGIPVMPEALKIEPAVLQGKTTAEISRLREQFESALMEGIRKFQSPLDEVILYMAHFNKRFNRKMLEFFFLSHLDPSKRARAGKKMLIELKELPFVKFTNDDYFVLHDEMARLVQMYVWDTVEDPDRTLRKELSEKICQYYEQELKSLPKWENSTEQQRVTRRSYEVEELYYRLYADFRLGFWNFENLFETLTNDRRSGLATLALNFFREFKTEPDFSRVLQCFINGYYSGGILIARQKFEEASNKLIAGERELTELLASHNWSQAGPLDHYLRERSHLVYQQLGYCYRSMGDWKYAEDNYQRALNLALETAHKTFQHPEAFERKKAIVQQFAETLNNLANLYRLTGEFHDARHLCQTSIALRQAWGLNTVMSYYVMSMILWEMGDTSVSVSYLTRAEKECTDEYRLALLKKYRAYILFRTGLTEQALPILDEAESLFRQKGLKSELADTLNIRCRIYQADTDLILNKTHRQSYMKYIEVLSEEAYILAKQSNDKFRLAECHLTRAFHYFKWSKIDRQKTSVYQQMALEQWHQGVGLAQDGYHQIYSLYCQLRGDIAFDAVKPDHELAFEKYIEQCKVSTHFKEATYERAIDHLGECLRSLGATEPQRALSFINKVAQAWTGDPEVNHRTDLTEELQEVTRTIKETEKLKELKVQYDQALLEGRLLDATRYSDEILEIPGFYTDANRAEVLLAKSQVAHRQEHFAEARRYANLALQIGYQLKAEQLIGNAHLMLTSILWDTTSTAEAAHHLKSAIQVFKKIHDRVGLARAQRFQCYILYRTGNFERLLEQMQEIVAVFEENHLHAELADIKNIMSRVARTSTIDSDPRKARKLAEEALAAAELSRDAYRKAECLLSMAALSQREKKYENTLAHYRAGVVLLPQEAHAIRTVYEGIQGSAYYELAKQAEGSKAAAYWDNAFDAFGKGLVEAAQSKPASLVRALELLFDFLTHLPTEEQVGKYTQRVEEAVEKFQNQHIQLERNMPAIKHMLALVRQFYPFLRSNSVRKEVQQ